MKNFKSDEPCICCGLAIDGMVCYHHLRTRAAAPHLINAKFNQIPVCQDHHNQFHRKGITWMADNFPSVERWLLGMGWERVRMFKDRPRWMAPSEI